MTIKELLIRYIKNQEDAISTIRQLSGIFNPDHAVDTLAIICLITRVEQGDADRESVLSILGIE